MVRKVDGDSVGSRDGEEEGRIDDENVRTNEGEAEGANDGEKD